MLSPEYRNNLKLKGHQFSYNLARNIIIMLVKIKGVLHTMAVVCCSGEKWYLLVRTYELLSAFVGFIPRSRFFKEERHSLYPLHV